MEQVRPLTIEELDLPKRHPVTRLLDNKQRVLADLSSSLYREREGGVELLPGDRPKPKFANELLPELSAVPFTLDPYDLMAIWRIFQIYDVSEMQTSFMMMLSLSYGIQRLDEKWSTFPRQFLLSENQGEIPQHLLIEEDLLTLEVALAQVSINLANAATLTKSDPTLTSVHGLLNNDVKNGVLIPQLVIGSALKRFNR